MGFKPEDEDSRESRDREDLGMGGREDRDCMWCELDRDDEEREDLEGP